MDHLHDAAFLNSPMGLSLLGTPNTVSVLTDKDISEFVSSHYLGCRYIVAASGAVDHAVVTDITESLLGNIKTSKVGEIEVPLVEAPFIGSDKRMRYDNKPLAHVALAFKGASAGSEYALPLQLITSIMGKWDRRSGLDVDTGSRWHLALAEHNIANQAEAYSIGYKDTGIVGFTGVGKDISLDNFMWFSLESLVRMCHKVTDEEVMRGKVALKTKLMNDSSIPSGACSEIASQVMSFGRRIHPAELFARIDALSTSDVRTTAYKFIHDQDHALSAVGPIYELPDYNWIRRRSYWLRY
jgi:processing peptidase subunit beta